MAKRRWSVTIERDTENGNNQHRYRRGLRYWAIVGLAVIGITAIAVWKIVGF